MLCLRRQKLEPPESQHSVINRIPVSTEIKRSNDILKRLKSKYILHKHANRQKPSKPEERAELPDSGELKGKNFETGLIEELAAAIPSVQQDELPDSGELGRKGFETRVAHEIEEVAAAIPSLQQDELPDSGELRRKDFETEVVHKIEKVAAIPSLQPVKRPHSGELKRTVDVIIKKLRRRVVKHSKQLLRQLLCEHGKPFKDSLGELDMLTEVEVIPETRESTMEDNSRVTCDTEALQPVACVPVQPQPFMIPFPHFNVSVRPRKRKFRSHNTPFFLPSMVNLIPENVQNHNITSSVPLISSLSRPGFGMVGKRFKIATNNFEVQLNKEDFFEYNVIITPEVASHQCREIMISLYSEYYDSHFLHQTFAYDGKNTIFTAEELPFYYEKFAITFQEKDGRENEYEVDVMFTARRDLHTLKQYLSGSQHDCPKKTIQDLDVVLRQTNGVGKFMVGKSIYSASHISDKGALGNGVSFCRGVYQCLRPTQKGLFINVDLTAKAFYPSMTVLKFVMTFFDNEELRQLSHQEMLNVENVLQGVMVKVSFGLYDRIYKIKSLTSQTTSRLKFKVDDNFMSLVQFYSKEYNMTLEYTLMPAIQAGTDANPIYLPMEICQIVDMQPYSKKLNEKQVATMVKATCSRPTFLESRINLVLKGNEYNVDRLLSEFGILVKEESTLIEEARVLPPPSLELYHKEISTTAVQKKEISTTAVQKKEISTTAVQKKKISPTVYPRLGEWQMKKLKVFIGANMKCWAIVNFSKHWNMHVREFCNKIVSTCNEKGMVCDRLPFMLLSYSAQHIRKGLCRLRKLCDEYLPPGRSLEMLFVILPEEDTGSYGKITKICDTEVGMNAQYIHPEHIMNPEHDYKENVVLNLNMKRGGTNAVLSKQHKKIIDRPTIIFGMDVNHPHPGEDSGLSIAAVVASIDWPNMSKYRALVSAQPHRQEIIDDLYQGDATGMIIDQLNAFEKSVGKKAERIIIYRAGVSEDQYNDVLHQEMHKIRQAFASFGDYYRPPVTYIFVQQEKHVHFFATDLNGKSRTYTDKSGNILPGTVVDTDICHPNEFDFYLCSHAGIQGTTTPSHYHVSFDENKFTADEMQTMTYNLCYTSAVCTKSLSIVPPAYYANSVACRARYYTDSESEFPHNGSWETRGRTSDIRTFPVIHKNLKNEMFFC